MENLLELSRAQAGHLKLETSAADFSQITYKVTSHLSSQSAVHQFIIDLPEGLPKVHLDPIRVERILHNLIDNAIKYSPQGGKVEISARVENGSLVACISDQGPGISPENQRRLFQSFERLELKHGRSIQGVGLGLKVCRMLVEFHDGKIWVDSELGKGSKFYFSLPLNGTDKR